MDSKRTELIKRNMNFIQIPMPNLWEMTNEQLEKRAKNFESSWEMELNDDDDEFLEDL